MKDEDVYCTYTYTYNAVLLCLRSITLFSRRFRKNNAVMLSYPSATPRLYQIQSLDLMVLTGQWWLNQVKLPFQQWQRC